MFGIVNQFGNGRHFITLFRSKYHLSTTDFNPAGAASQNSLNFLTFVHFKFGYIETHNSPPCKILVVSLRNIGIPIQKNLKLKLTF